MGFDKNIISDPTGGMPRLLEIMRALRDPKTGCPWDIEQSFESIAPCTVEEAYEVADAIARKDWDDLRDELGDLLLQAVYHAQIAEEEKLFNFDDIANGISDKMLRRHPHVFADESRDKSSVEQTQDWEKLKAAELVEAQSTSDQAHMAEEYGDLLFVMVNLGRHLNIDPEDALRQANAKFTRRFRHIENELNKLGKTLQSSSLTEMDAFWEEAKAQEKSNKA